MYPLGVVYVAGEVASNKSPPTATRPGTRERIEVYRRRAAQGSPVFVAGDYVDPELVNGKCVSYDIAATAMVRRVL